jgi:hypothetical protein
MFDGVGSSWARRRRKIVVEEGQFRRIFVWAVRSRWFEIRSRENNNTYVSHRFRASFMEEIFMPLLIIEEVQ